MANGWRIRDAVFGDLVFDPQTSPFLVLGYDLGYPAPRVVSDPNVAADGEDDRTEHHGARVLTLDVRLVGSAAERQAASMLLRKFMHPARRVDVHWTSDEFGTLVARRCRASGFAAPVPTSMNALGVRLAWVVPSGVLVSSEPVSALIGAGSSSTSGRTYDLAFDRVYPAATGAPGSGRVSNDGTTYAWPILRAYGPIVSPSIDLVTTGGVWDFTSNGGLTIAAGDWVEIDVAANTARINGSPASSAFQYLDYSTLSWAPLAVGANEIRYNGASGITAETALEVLFDHSYL